MQVKDCMTRGILYGNMQDSIYDLSRKMKENDVSLLPIIEHKKIIGLLTDRDIVVKIIANHDEKNIKDYLTKQIITVEENDTIEFALEVMEQNKIKRLLVTDDHKIVGILSLSDIIRHNNDNQKVMNTICSIFELNLNKEERKTEIDEFYL